MSDPMTVLAAVPRVWQERLRFALGVLRSWQASVENVRETDRLFHGQGRYEAELRDGLAHAAIRAAVAKAEEALAEFARLAKANGVDPEAVLTALGGRPAPDEEGPHVREWRRA